MKLFKRLRFTEADLTEDEIKTLVQAIHDSPGFTSYSENELHYYQREGRVLVLRADGQLCGISAYEWIGEDWAEITTIFILSEHRGKSFGKKLWRRTLKLLKGRNVCAVAFNPLTKDKLALNTGFKITRFFHLPFSVQAFFLFQRLRASKIIGFFTKKHLKWKNFDILTRVKKPNA